MQGSQSWRELLGTITKDFQERLRVAHALGVSTHTLSRWINGDSKPRTQSLRLLLTVFPEYRQQFLQLLPAEFEPTIINEIAQDTLPQEISSEFYQQVLHTHCVLPPSLRFSSLCDLILQQALEQLDPNGLGVRVSIIQCSYPSACSGVRSLLERIVQGTFPWPRGQKPTLHFLGAESLAGSVVTTGRSSMLQRKVPPPPALLHYWLEHEESVMCAPIMFSQAVAGCLQVSCTQLDYFLHLPRHTLIQKYAQLLTIAFPPECFYPCEHIRLCRFPPPEIQYPHMHAFWQRIADAMGHLGLNRQQAEQMIWRQIEEEVFQTLFP